MSKTWVRKEKIADVGKCRYCKSDMISTDSFVAFANHTKAHYKCWFNTTCDFNIAWILFFSISKGAKWNKVCFLLTQSLCIMEKWLERTEQKAFAIQANSLYSIAQ